MNSDAWQGGQVARPERRLDRRIYGRHDFAVLANVMAEAESDDGAGLDRRHPEGSVEPESAEVGPEAGLFGDERPFRLGIGELDGRDRYDGRRSDGAFLLDSTGFHIHSIAGAHPFVNFKDGLRFETMLPETSQLLLRKTFHVFLPLGVQANSLLFGDL